MDCLNSSASRFVGGITGGVNQQVDQSVHGVGAWTIPQSGGRRRKRSSRGKKMRVRRRTMKHSRKNRKQRTRKMRK